MIPKQFECMGFTFTVDIEKINRKDDGQFHSQEHRISISKDAIPEVQEQTFWHEFMHCALTQLGYDKLNDNEQFVDQMGHCLYQLQKTRLERE